MMIHTFLADIANKMPDKIAVIQGQRRVTYAELNHGLSRVASFLLKNDLQVGDRVGLLIENSPEYIILCFGIQRAGGISVAINPQYSVHEAKKVLSNCLATALIVGKKNLSVAIEAITGISSVKFLIIIDSYDIDESSTLLNMKRKIPFHIKCFSLENILKTEDCNNTYPSICGENIASIVYTSGTTGEPKGVMLSHDNFVANAGSIVKYLHLSEKDKVMAVLPFYYSYGTSLLTTHIMVGGSLVIENSFMYPNMVFDKMVEENVTGFAGVPSTFAILLNRSNIRNYRFPELRYVTQAGGPMSPRHTRELSVVLPNTDIFIMYGQTEATARLTYLNPQDLFRKLGSIGKRSEERRVGKECRSRWSPYH